MATRRAHTLCSSDVPNGAARPQPGVRRGGAFAFGRAAGRPWCAVGLGAVGLGAVGLGAVLSGCGQEPRFTAPSAMRASRAESDASTAGSKLADSGDEATQGAGAVQTTQSLFCELALTGSDEHSLLAVPLRVHVGHSALDPATLCDTFQEIGELWGRQAGICFSIEVTFGDEPSSQGLDLWFKAERPLLAEVDANGVYVGDHAIYSLDEPDLRWAEPAANIAAARTAAHELGHALGLQHQNCGVACDGLLMRSGTRGTRLVPGAPADRDEVAQARRGATAFVGQVSPERCTRVRLSD